MAVELETLVTRLRRYAAESPKCRLLLAKLFLLILELYPGRGGRGLSQYLLRYDPCGAEGSLGRCMGNRSLIAGFEGTSEGTEIRGWEN
jgi:hypothetical protein